MSIYAELKRRNVIRAAIAYAAIAWLVVQVVETLFPMFGLSNAAARAVVIILAIGFIPAVAFAWAFELTPDGFRRDSDVDRVAPGVIAIGKRVDRIVVVLLALAVGYFAIDKFVFDPTRDAALREQAMEEGRVEAMVESYGDSSIAVLPFLNMSSDAEQDYFSDGIAEELLNLLARIPELRVISRSSSFAFKGEDVPIPEIAERLDVAHILEGSVRTAGNRVRIAAQLIEARSDTHIWSHIYDRELDDVFAIQNEIAADVVDNLKLVLVDPIPTVRKTDPETLALVLQARSLEQVGHTESGAKALALLEEAVTRDPDYVPALLDIILINSQLPGAGGDSPQELKRKNAALLARVLSLEPDNPRLIAYMAWNQFAQFRDVETAATDMLRALQLDPNDLHVLGAAAEFANLIGYPETAVKLYQRTVSRDPLCFACIYKLAQTYRQAGQFDQALDYQKRYMERAAGGFYTLGLLHLFRDDPALTLEIAESGAMNDFNEIAAKAMALHDLGRLEKSAEAMEKHVAAFGDSYPATVAEAYAWVGNADAAFAWIDKAHGTNVDVFEWDLMDPVWRNLHGDPRWHELRERIGLPEERLAALQFDVELPD